MKGQWVQNLLNGKTEIADLKNKKGLLFSTITLEEFIRKEIRHEQFLLSQDRSIRTFSSGEQRKALLNYQINQQPDFIVLDNPFDCLDVESVAELKSRLQTMSKDVVVVQIFKRINDILPFIDLVLEVENNIITAAHNKNQYVEAKSKSLLEPNNYNIPAPIKEYENIPEVLLELRNVNVSYDSRKILNNINWTVCKREFWHLKGPNGSGKTTLLSMFYGDNTKAYGQDLYIFGVKKGSGESVWEIKEKMGYFTPSMTELFDGNFSAEQMIISGMVDSVGLYRKPTYLQQVLAKQWLDVLNLVDFKYERFNKLSQVNQRLVLIARAMIKHPPLLILDEPSTGLDDKSAELMVSLINKIANGSNTAIIYVSHRTEKGLNPKYTFELTPSPTGAKGKTIFNC